MEAIDNPTAVGRENLPGIGGQFSFLQTPTWSLDYSGPDLLETDKIILNYLMTISPHPAP